MPVDPELVRSRVVGIDYKKCYFKFHSYRDQVANIAVQKCRDMNLRDYILLKNHSIGHAFATPQALNPGEKTKYFHPNRRSDEKNSYHRLLGGRQ
jgi:hypothetical protein